MRILLLTVLLVLSACPLLAQPRTVVEWNFADGLQGWGPANHVTDLRVEDGALEGVMTNWDPWVTSPQFEIPARPWQRIEVRLKTDVDGTGLFYWTNTTESPYGGFFPEKNTPYRVTGDGQWREYHIYPFWQGEGNIILIRLDLPRPAEEDYGRKTFAVEWVRIVDLGEPEGPRAQPAWDFTAGAHGWSPMDSGTLTETPEGIRFTNPENARASLISSGITAPAEENLWVSVEMMVDGGRAAYLRWICSERSGMQSRKFPLRSSGRFHTYNIDMSGNRNWAGDLMLLGLEAANEPGATAVIRRITVSDWPAGGPELLCTYVGPENAINRAGSPLALLFYLQNTGGEPAADIRISELDLPGGVTVAQEGDWRVVPDLEPFDVTVHRIALAADQPAEGPVRVRLSGTGFPDLTAEGSLAVLAPLNLPAAEYVPEPRPVETDYEIGAFYFPGFPTMSRWEPIIRHGPERKPVLGWYDEGNPEVVDWQIRWAVENGIRFFLLDWYWSAGGRHLEHWINAYKQARYRSHLQWAMMWANHNAPNTHSEDDQRAVTRHWIDEYFHMPEYYRIDNRPVVMIWSPENMDRDMAGRGGAKRLLDISQEMAREAGYEGIYFIAMKWPEASTDPQIIQRLVDMGFSMTSIYHYMHHGGRAADATHFPFELAAESSYDHWQRWHEAGILPFLPNLSTGWDSTPWHGDRSVVLYDRTVPLFRRICEDAKRFADETGVTRMVLAPLNEWGEGSYAEPNLEYGFGMYEAVRDVFCREPAEGWPLNYAPADVGLGPYDLPAISLERRTEWDFADGPQGWAALMGVTNFLAEDGAMHFDTTTNDPAVHATLSGLTARSYPTLIIRMRVQGLDREDDHGQVFWSTTTATGMSEPASERFPLVADGEYHDYVLHLAQNPWWRGRIQALRFDPCSAPGVSVSVESVRFSRD